MRKIIVKIIRIKDIIFWSFFSWGSILMLIEYVKRFMQERAYGIFEDKTLFFIATAVVFLAFSTSRVIKHINLYKDQ